MNTNKLKAYAPKARLAFMQAVTKRAALLGLYEDRISDVNKQGDNAIIEGRLFTLKQGQQRELLAKRIKSLGTVDGELNLQAGFNQFINETAFTWFNRLTAIRYMEINGYLDHGFRVLSKSENATFEQGFEILAHAADVAEDLELDKSQIVQLMLDGDKEEELYREILLGQCHQLSTVMPFMFEKLDDETELLLPDNLTKTDSILKALINDLPEECWIDSETGAGQIEVIGWLYQFYISEHKDAVIGKVVKREDIPAATQLFTPNWIVKYLVQNSVGRQWLATYPDSELKDKMEYYITPAEQSDEVIEQLKSITPTSIDPETIKVLDPAVGSGHILVEVYEVLREIYLERGYRLREIPELILTKNIYGLDIDDRAAQMAAFAVLMKAREDDKRIFSRIADNQLKLNIYSMQSTENLDINQLWADLDFEEKQQSGDMADLFAESQNVILAKAGISHELYDLLVYLKAQFIDAKNLGSLIEIDSQYQDSLVTLKAKLIEKTTSNHQPTRLAVESLLPIVEQAIVLATKYSTAVANPPYMGSKGMNGLLKEFAKKNYPNSKSDLFAIFMERAFNFLNETGYNAQVNMQSWMFLSSFEKMRASLLDTKTFVTMAHLGARAFGQISGEVVQTTAWILNKKHVDSYQPSFLRLIEGNEESKKQALLEKQNLFDKTKQDDFNKIPSSPIAYWISPVLRNSFIEEKPFSQFSETRIGLITGDNNYYIRNWHEINFNSIGFGFSDRENAKQSKCKWFPQVKGGEFRKWYGNLDTVLDWSNDGMELQTKLHESGVRTLAHNFNLDHIFKPAITWTKISGAKFGARIQPEGCLFNDASASAFPKENWGLFLLGTLCSKVIPEILSAINPTLNFLPGSISILPVINNTTLRLDVTNIVKELVYLTKNDWDSYESSYEFKKLSFIFNLSKSMTLRTIFDRHIEIYCNITNKAQKLEQELNSILIEAYGLIDEIEPYVELSDITLTRNPYFQYSNKFSIQDKVTSENNKEILSYSIGCMMGRYSLNQEGLVYAHSGNEGFKELEAQGAYKTFPADDDGIIPLASEEWLFDDDATARFKEFVKTVWGEEHLTENLDFVAESLCLDAIKPKRGEGAMDTIRRYFSTKFYKDHLKTYKKRPIYWLFSSGKEKAFECLVYLHRYNESTLARMRTEYVTPLMGKMETQLSLLAESADSASSTAEKNRLNKELKSLQKKQAELRTFDEELKHYSELKISLDLDDGVKINYGKFGNLLADVKAIHGSKPEAMK